MISVIIPTYNSDKYICEALDSVLQQTYTDYEIIVIDDGSTDSTRTIIDNRYNMVRYYYVKNNGVSAARNSGISMAQGELIAFLDADDMWLPEKLEKQASMFNKNDKLGLVFTENYFFNGQGISEFSANKRARLMRGDIVKNIFLNSYVVTSTVMVRKSVFDHVGLFEEDLQVAEDDNMWMRIGMKYDIALLDERLAQYRTTVGSLSSDSNALIIGGDKQIKLLRSRYSDLYDRLGPLTIRKKYADFYFSEAYRDFMQGNYSASRSRFLDSYMNNPFRPKSLIYFLSSFLPSQAIEMIRGVKRGIVKKAV